MASHSIQLLYLPKASAGISTEATVVPMNIYPLCRFKQSVARSTCYKQAGWKFRHNLVMQSMAIMLLFPTSCTVLTACAHTLLYHYTWLMAITVLTGSLLCKEVCVRARSNYSRDGHLPVSRPLHVRPWIDIQDT